MKRFLIVMAFSFLGLFSCKGYKDLNVNEFEQMIGCDASVQLVDARTPEEFAEGHLGGAVNIDWKAGDTEDVPEMAELKDIDIAFLPVNQPYTMTPEQCIAAAKVIGPNVLIPYHYSQTDLSPIPAALPDMDVRIRQLQ